MDQDVVLPEIVAALQGVADQAVNVSSIVSSVLVRITNMKDQARFNRLVNTYKYIVRIHLALFQLMYNAEMRNINVIIGPVMPAAPLPPLAIEEIEEAEEVHQPPSPPLAPPVKRRRIRGDRACIVEGRQFLRDMDRTGYEDNPEIDVVDNDDGEGYGYEYGIVYDQPPPPPLLRQLNGGESGVTGPASKKAGIF